MSWQVLIWNMFVWTFTGVLIYVKDASMWWLIIPLLFTTTQNAAELYRKMEESKEDDEYELDAESRKKLMAIVENAERRLKR